VDFVRQGAFLATAMLLMQQNPEHHSKAKAFRTKLTDITSDQKHSSTMTLMGSVLAQGVLDAGGRNVTIDLMSHSGVAKAPAVVGMALFTQYWFWYPMMHMLSLTFTPTALIGVNWQLDLPKDFKVRMYVLSMQACIHTCDH
jgi:26S proteasome regulatory subunit N2